MNRHHHDELDDLFVDPELRDLARRLSARRPPEAPLDLAFKSTLRRDLMRQAWAMAEPRLPWWRRLTSPVAFSWAGATLGLVLIAFVVVSVSFGGGGSSDRVMVAYNIPPAQQVTVDHPIQLTFNKQMDQGSVESAVRIEPATKVTYEWSGNGTQVVLKPVSGSLAPNTQYQVKLDPAKAANQQTLSQPQSVTFVTVETNPSPAPTPRSSPSPAPTPRIAIQSHQALGPAGSKGVVVWSPDLSVVYYVGPNGSLMAAPSGGGPTKTLPAEQATLAAVSPDGTQVAYASPGQVSVVPSDGKSPAVEIQAGEASALAWQPVQAPAPSPSPGGSPAGSPSPAPAPVPPAPLVFVQGTSVFATAPGGTPGSVRRVATLAAAPTEVWLAPNGERLLFRGADGKAHLVELTGTTQEKPTQVSPSSLAWAPDGSKVIYSTADGIFSSDPGAQEKPAKLASLSDLAFSSPDKLELAWSRGGLVLAGNGSVLWAMRTDGSRLTKLDHDFSSVVWAPKGDRVAFHRDNQVWVAIVKEQDGSQPLLADGTVVVTRFMQARLAGNADAARAELNTSGQDAYKDGLVFQGEPKLGRYYVVGDEVAADGKLRYTVRLVLTQGGVEKYQLDETLVLVTESDGKLRIDKATRTPRLEVGKGPSVVAVAFDQHQVRVTFDSDLDPATLSSETVTLQDHGGRLLAVPPAGYADRILTISVPQGLSAGATYKLRILGAVKDFQGKPMASDYSFELTGPPS